MKSLLLLPSAVSECRSPDRTFPTNRLDAWCVGFASWRPQIQI